MKISKGGSSGLLVFGYALFVLAVLGVVADLVQRELFSLPFDIGVIFGGSAFAVAGLVAISAGKGLKLVEDRLDRIERSRSGF